MEREYSTKQKDVILKSIKNCTHDFTIKDIYNSLMGSVGLTTIYRLVDKLVRDGKLNKYITKDNITYYEYLGECECENHFYLKCDKCGTLIHTDCYCIEEMSNHILKEHKFSLSRGNIVINGICNKCLNKSN